MKIVVQKYGGTSVNTEHGRKMIIENMLDAKENGLSSVIVVSAMGRKPAPYATDSLISLLPNPSLCDARSKDMLVSLGEIITTVVVSEEMEERGIKAIPLTGGQAGIVTNSNFGYGEIERIDTKNLLSLLEKGITPIVAGFQGMNDNKEIVTLGRGGSDITATALGGALKAEIVEIYTDVDGVMTADPRVVEDAELIDRIDYEDVFQLAEYGAKVIHPRAVEFAMKANVPISVLNTNNGRQSKGTLIEERHYDIKLNKDKIFQAVTQMDNCSQIEIKFTSMEKEDKLFKSLAKEEVSIDMINIFPDKKTFIISSDKAKKVGKIMKDLELDFTITDNFSKITVKGRINGVPGVVAQIVGELYSKGIFVYQSSDSSTTVSVLVETSRAKEGVKALHTALISK